MSEKPNTWGIYDNKTGEFVYGILADSNISAIYMLKDIIGDEAYQYRYVPRRTITHENSCVNNSELKTSRRKWNPDFVGTDDEYKKAYHKWYHQEKKDEIKDVKRKYYYNNRTKIIDKVKTYQNNRKRQEANGERTSTAIIGIYGIKNIKTGKWYIGQSINIMNRLNYHMRELAKGTHDSKKLQLDYDESGITNFQFIVVEECEKCELTKRENEHIIKYNAIENGYNNYLPVDEPMMMEA